MLDFQEVCSRFHIARQGRDTAQAFCPVHNGGREKVPSLTLSRGADGRTLVYCHVCGKEGTKDILSAVGLQLSDIQPDRKKRGKTVREFAEWPGRKGEYSGAKFVESYDYANESGYAYTKCRVSLPDDRKKTFRYCRTDAEGYVSEFKVKDRKNYGALYPYKALQAARNGEGNILYVEGEKDAKNALKDGLQAVTAGSANDFTDYHVDLFKDLRVFVVPDFDKPGLQSAASIARALQSHGVDVKVIRWPDSFTVPKGDYSDFIETFQDRAAGVAAFRELMNSAVTPEEFSRYVKEWKARNQQEELQEQEESAENEVKAIAQKIRDSEDGKIFEITDLKCGEMIGQFFEDCRYNKTAREWYWYDGKRWTLDADGMHVEGAAAVFTDALIFYSLFYMNGDIPPDDVLAFRAACGSLTKRARRIAAIQDARKVRCFSSDELDKDTALFNCQNGVLNLDSMEFLPHKPEYMLSKISGCEYRPEAGQQAFTDFLKQVLQDDEEKIRFLQTFTGYILRGKPEQECFLILYGATTRNGKGTFCETLMRMFGDYGASIRPESLATKHNKDGSGASDDIARLSGVRFLNCSEPPKGMHIDEALVKSLTGGDKITARHLFERFFEFYPQFTILMNVNFLPVVSDTTLFTSGRVMVLKFDRHFMEAEQDKGLKARLQQPENLSAVLNWTLEGLKRYKAEGLKRPDSVITATAEYSDDSDKIKRFFAEELEEMPGHNETAADVYGRFVSWCKRTGIGSESKQNFFQLLRQRELLTKSATVNGRTVRNVVCGYKLTEWQQVDEEPDLPEGW